MNRRDFCGHVAVSGFALTASATAFAQAKPIEGQQYIRITKPVAVGAPGKIDVAEFFSYACPHCNAFEPIIEPWAHKLPADVAFRRIPVPFLDNHDNFQKLYFALETMGVLEQLHGKVFNAYHVDRNRLGSLADMTALVTKNGVDGTKFQSVFNSFGVQAKARQATQLTQEFGINGVPSIGVQGRFLASGDGGASGPAMLPVVDFLIQRVRTNA